jgi:uncharacterized protein YdaU (DUF1376 family)
MNYYKRHIGDYYKKAGRLSILQHGAYTLIIDACYDREQFPTLSEAIDWAWASSKEEIEAVEFVLSRFFRKLEDGRFIQDRILDDLERYWANSATNKRIAIEREAKRREKSTNREQVVNEPPPNHKPLTSNQEPEKKKRIAPKRAEPTRPAEIPENLWADFLAVRKAKKAPLTETALNGILSEAKKAGITLGQALTCCCERNWQGFKASWYQNANTGGQQPGGLGRHPITTAQGANYETTPDEDLPESLRG